MQDKMVQIDVKVTELQVCDNCIDLGIRGPLDTQDILAIADLVGEWGMTFIQAIMPDWDKTRIADDPDVPNLTCDLCHGGERDHLHIATTTVVQDLPDDIRSFAS